MFTSSRLSRRPILATVAALSALALPVSLAVPAAAAPDRARPCAGGCVAVAPVATLDPAVAESVRFTREEERMARDLYAALADLHDGARPMSRITLSEQRHVDAVGTLLTRYGLTDPSAGRPAGDYAYPELTELYARWLAMGTESLAGAYQAGIELEQRDIADLEALVAAGGPADVVRVYENLLAGSRNHLAAYQNAAERLSENPDGTDTRPRDGSGAQGGRGNGRGAGMGRCA